MQARELTLTDRIFGEIDKAIKVLANPPIASQAAPRSAEGAPLPAAALPGEPPPAPGAQQGGEQGLDQDERIRSGRLMRVNHAGEVAAQALYRGQALTARDPEVVAALHRAGDEEYDHLAWCAERMQALGARASLFNPLWYAGAFALGALAGLRGRAGLGFVTETERQVESHLTDHLERLPAADHASRAVLEQMRADEVRHGAMAIALGGKDLPAPVKLAMRLTSRLMTRGSYWL